MKIDTEGYETQILEGSENVLKNTGLMGIIIELWKRRHLHKKLLDYGFQQYKYNPFERKLNLTDNYNQNDALYLRNIDFINDRIRQSPKFCVSGKTI